MRQGSHKADQDQNQSRHSGSFSGVMRRKRYSHISIPCAWEAVQLQEQVTLVLPGPPGAVTFCMGLDGPGHRSGERAAAVGTPRRRTNSKLPAGSGSAVRRSLRVAPNSVALYHRSPDVGAHAMFESEPVGEGGRESENGSRTHRGASR